MEDKKTVYWVIGIALVLFFVLGGMNLLKGQSQGAVLDVKLSIVEPETFAIVTGTKTLVDVVTVPFDLTITNGGQIPFTNVRIGTGTIPPALATAFAGKSIAALGPGESKHLIANVDVASLAPATGSNIFNFQAYILADYAVGTETFTKSGFSSALPVTISPSAGIAVSVTYS